MNFEVEGLTGDVFELDGKVAGIIPTEARPGANLFHIQKVWPETEDSPAWADMMIDGKIAVRIIPEICELPCYRLFDCVALIVQHSKKILKLKAPEKARFEFGGEAFLFWPETIADMWVIMCDSEARMMDWGATPQDDENL